MTDVYFLLSCNRQKSTDHVPVRGAGGGFFLEKYERSSRNQRRNLRRSHRSEHLVVSVDSRIVEDNLYGRSDRN